MNSVKKKLFYIGMKRQSMFAFLNQVQNASTWVFISKKKIREKKKSIAADVRASELV